MRSTSRDVCFDDQSGAWLLTRHGDCLKALRDPRFSATLGQAKRLRTDRLPPSMLNTDPPVHRRLRSAAAPLVDASRVRQCSHQVAAAAEHLAGLAVTHREVDLITSYAAPIASVTLVTLFGVPSNDLLTFTRLARSAAVNLDPLADETAAKKGKKAADELVSYFDLMIAERRMSTDGGIAALLSPEKRTTQAGATTSLDEILSNLVLIVVGGFEPLVHLIGNGIFTLLRWPGELNRLRANPDLWRVAIDELLRAESPIPFTARVCTRDMVMDNQSLIAGDLVIASLSSGNRDPAVFVDPETVKVNRRPNPMLAFGAGTHICLAASLVREVGRIALQTAVQKFPSITLLDERPVWLDGLVPHGLARLPVRIGA
jgi:cytochrome P450